MLFLAEQGIYVMIFFLPTYRSQGNGGRLQLKAFLRRCWCCKVQTLSGLRLVHQQPNIGIVFVCFTPPIDGGAKRQRIRKELQVVREDTTMAQVSRGGRGDHCARCGKLKIGQSLINLYSEITPDFTEVHIHFR